MATHRIFCPRWRPATTNQLMRGTFRQRMRLAKIDREMVGTYAMVARTPTATGKRRVTLEITLTGRMRESDVDASWKSTLDACKHARLIIDDSVRWCELGGITYRRGEDWGTVVEFVDLEDCP